MMSREIGQVTESRFVVDSFSILPLSFLGSPSRVKSFEQAIPGYVFVSCAFAKSAINVEVRMTVATTIAFFMVVSPMFVRGSWLVEYVRAFVHLINNGLIDVDLVFSLHFRPTANQQATKPRS
jgi:hypothetical protein